MIKKVVKNIANLKTRKKEKGFKNLLPRYERKLKRVKTKQPLFTSAQICKKARTGDKLYNSKADLWEAIKTTMSAIESAEIKQINKIRLLGIIEKIGYYFEM